MKTSFFFSVAFYEKKGNVKYETNGVSLKKEGWQKRYFRQP